MRRGFDRVRRARGDGDESRLYVALRRILVFLEHSLDRGLQWIGFEPTGDRRRPKRRRRFF